MGVILSPFHTTEPCLDHIESHKYLSLGMPGISLFKGVANQILTLKTIQANNSV